MKAEEQAKIDRDKMQRVFTEWMSRYVKDWKYVNLGSTTQMQQLFFGHYKNKVLLDKTRVFSIEKDAATLEAESAEVVGRNKYASWTAVQIKEEVKARGMKHTGKKTELLERLLEDDAGGNRRDETIPSITPPVVSADDIVHTESVSSDMKPYETLTVKQLQDICTARRLNFHHYNPDTDLRTALCKLIADDVAKFKSKNVGESTVWPNTPLESNSYLPQRSIYEADNSSLGNESETQTTKAENFAEIAQLKTPKRSMEFTIESFGIKPIEFTPAGVPKVGNMVLRELGGSGVYSGIITIVRHVGVYIFSEVDLVMLNVILILCIQQMVMSLPMMQFMDLCINILEEERKAKMRAGEFFLYKVIILFARYTKFISAFIYSIPKGHRSSG